MSWFQQIGFLIVIGFIIYLVYSAGKDNKWYIYILLKMCYNTIKDNNFHLLYNSGII